MLRAPGCGGQACRGLLGRPCDQGSWLHTPAPASLDPTQDVREIHSGSLEERGAQMKVDESAVVTAGSLPCSACRAEAQALKGWGGGPCVAGVSPDTQHERERWCGEGRSQIRSQPSGAIFYPLKEAKRSFPLLRSRSGTWSSP